MRYRLICFDAGFTLIEPRRSTAATLAAVLGSEGIPPTEDMLRRAWDAADSWFLQEYHRPSNDTWISDDRIHRTWLDHHGLMLKELRVDDLDQRLANAVIAAYNQPENWQLYPDVLPALDALKRPERTFGVVSDWSSRLPLLLETLGVDQYFDFILVSATAGAAKPSAEFYRMALQKTGVAPSAALMVGDSYAADILGARAAGMDAVLLDRRGDHPAEDVPVIRALTELVPLVD